MLPWRWQQDTLILPVILPWRWQQGTLILTVMLPWRWQQGTFIQSTNYYTRIRDINAKHELEAAA